MRNLPVRDQISNYLSLFQKKFIWIKIQIRVPHCNWEICLEIPPLPSFFLTFQIFEEPCLFLWYFPMVQVWLILFLQCCYTCSFVLSVACKSVVGSRVLIRLRFIFLSRLLYFFIIYLYIYIFFFLLYSMVTQLHIHVYILFSPIIMLYHK